jgi:hypothetical protein
VALSGLTSLSAQAREKFVQAGGIEYYDAVIGKGETTFDGDTIRVTFTAHTYDPETGKKIKTFDPFITGTPTSLLVARVCHRSISEGRVCTT